MLGYSCPRKTQCLDILPRGASTAWIFLRQACARGWICLPQEYPRPGYPCPRNIRCLDILAPGISSAWIFYPVGYPALGYSWGRHTHCAGYVCPRNIQGHDISAPGISNAWVFSSQTYLAPRNSTPWDIQRQDILEADISKRWVCLPQEYRRQGHIPAPGMRFRCAVPSAGYSCGRHNQALDMPGPGISRARIFLPHEYPTALFF